MPEIYELRIYTLAVGAMPKFIASQTVLTPISKDYITPVAMFRSEIGPQNQVFSLWRYDSLVDRHNRRGALQADPRWAAEAGPIFGPLVVSQTSRLYRPPGPWTPQSATSGPRPFLYGQGGDDVSVGWCGHPLDAPTQRWFIEPFADLDAAELGYGGRGRVDQMLLLPMPHSPWQ